METLKETIQRLIAHYQFRIHKSIDIIRDSLRFYRKFSFLKKDLYRAWLYLNRNSFTVSNEYDWKEEAYGLDIYGETPLSTLNTIAYVIQLSAQDTVYDLGSSSGRTSLFLNEFYGCKVVGVELNPEFHKKACHVLEKYPSPGVAFQNANFFDIDYSHADVIYWYSTGLQDTGIQHFLRALKSARKGTKIITVSVRLDTLDTENTLKMIQSIKGYYYWGKATVYIHEKL